VTATIDPRAPVGRFSVPRVRANALPRPRLTSRMHARIGDGVMVLQAPAGYGKSALAAVFVAEVEYNVRWLSLDASCISPEVFADQLGRAIAGDAIGPPPYASKLDDLKAHLGGAVEAAVAASEWPLMLVIDNVHELRDALDSADILGWLLESLPQGTEVILSGREAAPLVEIDRRLATNDCLLLGSADLAFSKDEVVALLDRAGRADPASELLKCTDGWPVGVMAVLACSVSLDGQIRSEAGAAWERYLIAEVWNSVPERLQPAMLMASILTTVESKLGVRLVGDKAWRELHHWLTRHDFLLEPVADDRVRLNPLFRQFLRSEFQRLQPERFAEAVVLVATELEASDRFADAVELARSAEHHEVLAGLLERHSQQLLHHGAFALLWRGYETLPRELLDERPVLHAIHSRVLAHNLKPNEALEEAAALLARDDISDEARIHGLLGRIRGLRLLGRSDELKEIYQQVQAVSNCEDASLVGELKFQEAHYEMAVTSDFARAERLLGQTIAHCREAGRAHTLELLASSTLGQLLVMKGDGPAAVTALTRAAQGWREMGKTSNLGWVLNNLGMAHLSVGDFESAVSVLKEARREAEACENDRTVAYSIASLGDAYLALARYDDARLCYEETIKICAEGVPDESLTSLSIAGLASSLVGLGDIQQADFYSVRAMLVATTFGNPFEIGTCQLQRAQVESASGNHPAAIAATKEAIGLFRDMAAAGSLRVGLYRLALCQFRAGHRTDAQETLVDLAAMLAEPWTVGVLLPVIREHPMFAQWAASRNFAGSSFRTLLERNAFAPSGEETLPFEPASGRLPRVVARSLGTVSVTVGGREVTDEGWSSSRAKELFFLFLANRSGLRKEEAVEALYPDLAPEKCNSAFHSNLYRMRKALYQDSVVKRDGAYVLNPEAEFEWDVESFEQALAKAAELPAGSDGRANQYRDALNLYRGAFGESFFSEWAEALRLRLAARASEALSVLAGYYAGREDYEAAASCMEQILRRDHYNDDAAYNLASYRMKGGQPVIALAVIDDYRRVCEQDLGGALPERLLRLRSQIAAGAAV